jgi:hypothetical protein
MVGEAGTHLIFEPTPPPVLVVCEVVVLFVEVFMARSVAGATGRAEQDFYGRRESVTS